MEIKVNLVISADATLTALLSGLIGSNPGAKVATEIMTKTIKEEKEKPAKEKAKTAKPEENGAVDLSTIRQHLAKSEANKQAARELLKDYKVEKLTDLDQKHYGEFYTKLTAEQKDDL